ncbi:MAG TPA: hypothetical protein VFN31_02310, partial [Candidatus Saccharimonadales bacterium]|nr:hypothetical protein [Candidatus Saccharimonadales bacterium]
MHGGTDAVLSIMLSIMTDMISELQRQAINPPAGDERIAAFSQAFVHYASTPEGEDWLGIIEGRKFEAVSYGANLLLRAVQKQLLPQDAYPYEYDEESAWHEAFVSIANNTQSACQLRHDLETKVTQSNVVERYKAFKLTMELAAPVISGAPTILDVGCSRNHGLKKLALNLPFK